MEYVIGLIFGILASLAAAEFLDWTPRLTEKLIEFATSRLPEELRDRCREEWLADISDRPGKLSRLIAAADLVRGVALTSWAPKEVMQGLRKWPPYIRFYFNIRQHFLGGNMSRRLAVTVIVLSVFVISLTFSGLWVR